MSSPRWYAISIVGPPLVVAFPLAIAFVARATNWPAAMLLEAGVIGLLAYGLGAFVAGFGLQRLAKSLDDDVEAGRNPSASLSRALTQTTLISSILWIVWGFMVNVVAMLLIAPTALGFQYFAEATLIVAAPAMAWSYWGGKRLLLQRVAGVPRVTWVGRSWSIGIKIAIVFISFFFVAVGAIVLVIASRVATLVGPEVAREIGTFGLTVAVITTAAIAGVTWFLAQDIIRPLDALSEIAHEMAEGHFGSEMNIFSDDETGILARSFGTTRENLRSLLHQVGGRGEAITDGVERMTGATDSLVANTREQTGMAAASRDALGGVRNEAVSVLAGADHIAEKTLDSASRTAQLRASFSEVGKRMDMLVESVEKSSSAAVEIDASATESAARASRLAAAGSDVLAFVAQMDATIAQISGTARSTADLSRDARQNALNGTKAVDETVEGIRSAQDSTRRTAEAFDSLQKSLGQIDQILTFIDDVTNRTNLLSLNAAIIAAQAGEQDHGFSVIADEVRELADRTRNATREIATIIRGVQPVTRQAVDALSEGVQNVDRSVALAHGATTALAAILESSDKSLDMTLSMAKALDEQARASRHLHSVASTMTDHITEMQRASEGQAEATRMLALEAENVSDIALHVKRATVEQTSIGDGIAVAMEGIDRDVRAMRDRLEAQMRNAENVSDAAQSSLAISERNDRIAEEFRTSLQRLVQSGRDFEAEVARFRV